MDWSHLIVPGLSALGSFAGAWFGARFALARFYRERMWDKKAEAYTSIFEAIFETHQWYRFHNKRRVGFAEAEAKKVLEQHQRAREEFGRRVARQAWIISDNNRAIINDLDREVSCPEYDTFDDLVVGGDKVFEKATEKLRANARLELELRPFNFRI